MKLALVTTTIRVPEVLRHYRLLAPSAAIYVAGDSNTAADAEAFCTALGCTYLPFGATQHADWECDRLIGAHTVARRSLAILAAVRGGADVIVTIDDDNIPLDDYFSHFLRWTHVGLAVNRYAWFDPGRLLTPPAPQRGMPFAPTHRDDRVELAFVGDAKLGVIAGTCLGDPDISAVERLANQPILHGASAALHAGVAVTGGRAVFNSQNTAFLRVLAPCFLMCPQFGRYDDIFASLIAQRVMRETGHVVRFGPPFVWQCRNQHDLFKDLDAERWGYQHVVAFAHHLDGLQYLDTRGDVLDMIESIYCSLALLSWMPPGVHELGSTWCEDMRRIL